MKTLAIISPFASVLLALPASVCAEVPASQSSEENHKSASSIVGAGGPLDRAGAGITASSLQFDTEQGDTDVTLNLKFQLNGFKPEKTKFEGIYRISHWDMTISGTTPIGDQNNDFSLFGSGNLVNGSKLKVSIARTASQQRSDGNIVNPILNIHWRCVEIETRSWASTRGTQGQEQAGKYRTKLRSKDVRANNIVNIIRLDLTEEFGELGEFVGSKCADGDPLNNAIYKDQNYDELIRAVFTDAPVSFMGIDASIGRNKFNSLNRTDFRIDNVSRNSWEIGAFYGLIGSDLKWSVRARANYGKAFSAPDEIQFCRTVTGSTAQECLTAPDGLPKSIKTGIVSVEGRKIFNLGDFQSIAVAPQVSYNFETKNVGVEVPLYLAPDKKGKLSGGLKFAYSSKEDDFGVGLFVGVPFSIFFQ